VVLASGASSWTAATVSRSADAADSTSASSGSQWRKSRVRKSKKQRSLSVSPRSFSRSAGAMSASSWGPVRCHSGSVPLWQKSHVPR
jgi:hypothetical protein